MMAVPDIELPTTKLETFCRKWRIGGLSLFGSVLRDDFSPQSDVDFLVSFAPDADWSLLDHMRMEEELSVIIGRKVEIVSRRSIDRSENWIRRAEILGSAREVYAAG